MAHRLEFIGTQIGRMQRIFTDFLFDFLIFDLKNQRKSVESVQSVCHLTFRFQTFNKFLQSIKFLAEANTRRRLVSPPFKYLVKRI